MNAQIHCDSMQSLLPEYRRNVAAIYNRILDEMQAKRLSEKSVLNDIFWQRLDAERNGLPTTAVRTNKNNMVNTHNCSFLRSTSFQVPISVNVSSKHIYTMFGVHGVHSAH